MPCGTSLHFLLKFYSRTAPLIATLDFHWLRSCSLKRLLHSHLDIYHIASKVCGWLVHISSSSSSSLLPHTYLILLAQREREREREMGNCQAIDAATLVVQHPSGKVDTFYWPVSANEIMKMNPGHYVALLISTTLCPSNNGREDNSQVKNNNSNNNLLKVRLTKIKLLRPTDTLVLGQVYRLITTQEVMKGLWEKKQAKMKKNQSEAAEIPERVKDKPKSRPETAARNHVTTHERERQGSRTAVASSTTSATARPRTWQPSLKSISEAAS